MKKRLLALLLILVLLIPAGVASAATRYRVNTSSLKVRMMPSESAQVLASYRLDFVLTVQSTSGGLRSDEIYQKGHFRQRMDHQ